MIGATSASNDTYGRQSLLALKSYSSASLHCFLISETVSSHEALTDPTTQNLPVPDTSRSRIEVFECAYTVYCPWMAGILWFVDVIHHQDLCITLPATLLPA
jgi:hypothetical protein